MKLKNKLNRILTIGLVVFLSSVVSAQEQDYDYSDYHPAPLVDIEQLGERLSHGDISEEQYEDMMDALESGGDIYSLPVNPYIDWSVFTKEEQAEIQENLKDISAPTSIEALQKKSVSRVKPHGDWVFEFIYVDRKTGQAKTLSSYNANKTMRPASTQKLFTAWAAFKRGSYGLKNMKTMLIYRRNGMADSTLKSVAASDKLYAIPKGSYLNNLIGYKMWDSTERKNQVIDKSIARGCGILIDDYARLETGNLYHPVNGSGLQASDKDTEMHKNLVTARLQTSLLRQILNSKRYKEFADLLPAPGLDGTLRTKFKTLRTMAKVRAKTGTLANAKSLAGFIETKNGTIVFSIIGDNIRGVRSMREAHDRIIEDVVFYNAQFAIKQGL